MSSVRNVQAKHSKQFTELRDCDGKLFATLELLQTTSAQSAPRLWILDDRGRFVARVHASTIPVVGRITYSVLACDGPQQLQADCPKWNTTKAIEFKSPAIFFVDVWTIQVEADLEGSLATDLRVVAHIAALSASPRGIPFCMGIIFILVAVPICIIVVCMCIFHRRRCCAQEDNRKVDEKSLLTAGPEMVNFSSDYDAAFASTGSTAYADIASESDGEVGRI